MKTGNYIEEGNPSKAKNNEDFIQNKFYLIDKKWLEQWRKHVGYEEISKICCRNNINRDLTKDDYGWIKPYIEKNTKENKLGLLNNQIIYNCDLIDRLSDFVVIDKESYKSFTFEFNKDFFDNTTLKSRAYPVKILKEKLILMFDILSFQINFKDNESKLYFEVLIEFEQNNEGRKKTLDKIEETDINQWLKDSKINLLSEFSREFDFFHCKFKLINKTLLLYKNNQAIQFKNLVSPNLNNEKEKKLILLEDKITIPNGLKEAMTKKITTIKINQRN